MDGDVVSDLRRRYWSLVVTACEWRAYGVEAPEVIAARVFASLDHGRGADLRVLFRAVDKAVAQAYLSNATRRFTKRLVKRGVTVDDVSALLTQIKPGSHRRKG